MQKLNAMDLRYAFAFTGRFPIFRGRIVSYIHIISPDKGNRRGMTVKALWDTGSSETIISSRIADALKLKVSGSRVLKTSLGASAVCGKVRAAVCVLLGSFPLEIDAIVSDNPNSDDDCEVTLGLDFITQGDFAVSHDGGQLLFSFAYPPLFPVNYTEFLPKVNPDALVEECEDVDSDDEVKFKEQSKFEKMMMDSYLDQLDKMSNG